jgi:uncharacterized membrane protein
MKTKPDNKLLDAMRKNPDNWKWIFYVNRKDPRVIVPKLNPQMGWTLNFGNVWAIVGLVLILAIAVGWSVWL